MNDLATTYRQTRSKIADARRRGNVLVLCMVLLILLVMIGASFLQMTRAQRRSVQAIDTRHQDFDESILRYIARILAADSINIGNATRPFKQERYDYPWTNSTKSRNRVSTDGLDDTVTHSDLDATYTANITHAPGIAANHSYGGSSDANDDMWQASIEPDFTNAADPVWPHLTNLRGVFLDLDNVVTVAGSIKLPMQYLTTADADAESGDTGITLAVMNAAANAGKFADADLDGIKDSRWTWAPLSSNFGRRYAMAVRIIDNSALADLNVWNRMTTVSGTYSYPTDAAQLPRWYWPGELNLQIATDEDISHDTTGDAFLTAMMGERGVGLTPAGSGRSDVYARYRNWLQAGRRWDNVADGNALPASYSYVGSALQQALTSGASTALPSAIIGAETMTTPTSEPYLRFAKSNEAEIRWRNGLNRSSDNLTNDAITEIENVGGGTYSAWWRQAASVEVGYADTPYTSVQGFFEDENRKRFTIWSGAADHEKMSMNSPDASDIFAAIRDEMGSHPRAQGGSGSSWPDGDALAHSIAATVADFQDIDNILTKSGSSYGMEYLPFISEIYVQARYVTPVPQDNGSGQMANWTLQATEVAIEIVNPWPWPIEIPAGIKLIADGEEIGDLLEMIQASSATATTHKDAYLDGHETLLLVIDDTSSGAWPDYSSYGSALLTLDSTGYVWPDSGQTDSTNDANNPPTLAVDYNDIVVELQATDSSGDEVTYQKIESTAPTPTVIRWYTDVGSYLADGISDAAPTTGYMQYHTVATGDGLSVLTVREQDTDSARRDTTHHATGGSFEHAGAVLPGGLDPTASLHLGTHAKGASSAASDLSVSGLQAALDNRVDDAFPAGGGSVTTTPAEPFIIGNAGVVYRAGDLLRMVFLGPTDSKTIAEVWTDGAINTGQFAVRDFMLDLTATPTTHTTGGVNHATYLLDKFSTLRPDVDGVDNDGNGETDDETEHLIPGRLNLNTATRAMLLRALPIPTAADKTTLVNEIITARSDPTSRGGNTTRTSATEHLGLAYVGELAVTSSGVSNWGGSAIIEDNFADFNEYDPTLGPQGWDATAHNADGYTDDKEETTLALSALNQVASVRTDVVTAFILVRAYPAEDFTNGGAAAPYTPLEEFHIIATFDRSVIHTGRKLPRLISIAVYRQP